MELKEKPSQSLESSIKTEGKKVIPRIMPDVPHIFFPFRADAQKALVINSMFVPFSQLQASDKSLVTKSQHELEQNFINYLANPPDISENIDVENLNIDKSFDFDEDFILLTYINMESSGSVDFKEFIKEWLYVFKPCRSIESLEERVEEIKNWSEEQVEKFYDLYGDMILDEKLFADSTVPSCEQPMLYTHSRCSYEPIGKIAPVEDINNEISNTALSLENFMRDSKYNNYLAILRSEKYEFYMCSEAIMIGRGTADQIVDVEMNFVSEKPCIHISRNQAIISFLEDCNFYIENCGNKAFRVNGVLIPNGAMGILPPNAILDFSDALLVFIPNLSLVKKIKEDMKKTPQSGSKSKKKNENI